MQVKPVGNRILVQYHFPAETPVDLPDGVTGDPFRDEYRTKIEVLAVGEEVKVCKPGDFLLLIKDANRNMIPVSKEPPTGLIHDSVIIAIVLDDAQHVR